MIKKYVKGDRDDVLTRINQVSSITLNIPTLDKGVDYLYDSLMILCNHYVDVEDGDSFLNVPAIDFYNVVLFAIKCGKEKNVNMNYINAMLSIMRTFTNLKRVCISFKEDSELRDSYERLININSDVEISDVITELANVYSINVLDLYMGDMLDQKIIDLINKHFISNGILSNSYLEREFVIEFKFEEYISYMNMFIDNNIDRLSMMDDDIIDYLRVFPSIVVDSSRPNIRLYTNYKEV